MRTIKEQLIEDGLVWYDHKNEVFVGKASDGEIVCFPFATLEDDTAYFIAHPTPDTW